MVEVEQKVLGYELFGVCSDIRSCWAFIFCQMVRRLLEEGRCPYRWNQDTLNCDGFLHCKTPGVDEASGN